MTTQEQENKAIVRKAFTALNQQDREEFADLLTEDAVHHTPLGDDQGREEYVNHEFGITEIFSNNTYRINILFAEDDLVGLRATWSGIHTGEVAGVDVSGSEIELAIHEIYRIENGKIAEAWSVNDRYKLIQQLGVVTDLQVRNQYLSVLNRMLRHNLRNDLNAIAGYADVIAEEHEGSETDSIQTLTERLLTRTEKVRSLESEIVNKTLVFRELDVPIVLTEVADAYRASHPTVDISVRPSTSSEGVIPPADSAGGDDQPLDDPALDDLTVRTDRTLLETVVDELLENAIEHNDSDHPRVELTITPTPGGDAVRVSVADNGPGIPSHEIEPLQQGREEALVHASGIGLWTVKLAMERLDGDLRFEDADSYESVVILRIPDLEDTA